MQLRTARLCLDCEELHQDQQCPNCASEAFVYLDGLLLRNGASAAERGLAPEGRSCDSERPRLIGKAFGGRRKASDAGARRSCSAAAASDLDRPITLMSTDRGKRVSGVVQDVR